MPEVFDWSEPFEAFFRQAGLYQCLRALQLEALVFPTKTPKDINDGLHALVEKVQSYLARIDNAGQTETLERAATITAETEVMHSAASVNVLGSRGLDGKREGCMRDIIQNTMDQTQTRAKIDTFIARQQEGVGNSNQEEFLVERSGSESTCARTDAKGVSCGVKVQTEPGQGEKSALSKSNSTPQSGASANAVDAARPAMEDPLSGLEERVDNIRVHLSVEFVPESASIHRRVAALEDRIMQLEREYPPWSAEHFNQPCRRYTRPPQPVVYRTLPPSDAAPTSTSTSNSVPAPSRIPEQRAGTPRQPKPQLATSSKPPPTPKRQKTGVHANSPLDASGRPIFYACGRGVDSSLTRSVLAQLHSRQSTQPSKQERKTSPSTPKDKYSM
ncbi:hypothetical protein H4R20_005297 [Coemansia guatemalensis]|uniref:Uncharacterized protein n=1 Tax=Coemansia guatemalensis TaxID=2761395 RepID=A0A9W8LR95_9FUNG|nr:hypothetical protein H4R20_005297 [Coemansia guatemalensis]